METRLTEKRISRPRGKRLSALLLAALLGLLFCVPVCLAPARAANAAETPVVVRVGYFYNGDFMHKSDSGDYEGYDVEYYYTLAGYAGWKIQFVEYDSLKAALAALEKGDVDVMSGLSLTEERQAKYLVSNQKMCTAHIAVQTRADDDRFTAGDTSTMQELTCGILQGSNVVTLYTNWCKENNLVPHVMEYDSLDKRNAALASGEVDAIAGGSTIEGAQKIAEFPSLDLYFMFNRNRADLKAQLDRAMGILGLEDSSYAGNLFQKYFPSTRNSAPSFSSAEKEFIAAHPVIKVAALADDAPFSRENADGTVSGVLPDYYAHLSEIVGSDFQCVPYASKADACAALAAGEVDLVGKMEDNVFQSNQLGVILSVPYLKMNLVQLTRAGTETVRTAAVPECNRSAVEDILKNMDSSISVSSCANSEQSFRQLKAGETDAVICTQAAATWLLNRNRSTDYVVSAFGSDTWNVSCALSCCPTGNTIRSILNKTFAVDGGYINQLITTSTLQDSADFASFLDRMPASLLAALAMTGALLLVITGTALVIIIRRRSAERRIAAQQVELSAAMETTKARHAFFGTVSHDMRTPLNGIMGFTDLALKSDDPETVRGYLNKIRTSGAILSNLVNDTLIMSRIENGKYTLNPTPTDTTEIVEGILQPVREMAGKKHITLTDNLSQLRRRCVMVDRLSLQKIFLNLLTNAIKFTPEGGTVSLSCVLNPTEGGEPESVITVSDTGQGISPAFLPHIFEPFAQENPSNADTSGSGMGLAIVKGIVDAMGGTIAVSSESGKGTTFTVKLHLSEVEAVKEKEPAAAPGASVLNGKRVLVCEDNALNLEIVRSILERSGMKVTGAENGRLGLEKFEESAPGTFDAILLDLRMPVMDGKSAARAIRALPREDAETIPILAVSADAYPENVEECLEAGMNGHVAKPINAAQLVATLAKLM